MNTSGNSSTGLSVGKEVVCYCTRCKMDLGHTIMAMIKGVPARVVCRTCKSEHNYKPKRGVSEPGGPESIRRSLVGGTRAPREKIVEKTVPVEVEWMRQINASTKPKREYAANEPFGTGDRLVHPTFGEGIVQKLLYPNKIEVLFKMDLKTLIHSGK
jgi:hypothetical protein